eukprot:Awhi_evm1s2416
MKNKDTISKPVSPQPELSEMGSSVGEKVNDKRPSQQQALKVLSSSKLNVRDDRDGSVGAEEVGTVADRKIEGEVNSIIEKLQEEQRQLTDSCLQVDELLLSTSSIAKSKSTSKADVCSDNKDKFNESNNNISNNGNFTNDNNDNNDCNGISNKSHAISSVTNREQINEQEEEIDSQQQNNLSFSEEDEEENIRNLKERDNIIQLRYLQALVLMEDA